MDDNASTTQTTPTVDADTMDATLNLIQRLSSQLDELKAKQKELNDMVKGVFANDDRLTQAEEKATEAKKEAKDRVSELNETAEVKELKIKITDVKEDIKMVEESLNTHLVNYFQMTSSMVIDLPDGTEREFKLQAKLKPAKSQ